jgi:chromate transporter
MSLRQVLDAVGAGQVTPGPVFTTATFHGCLIGRVPAALVATAAILLRSVAVVIVLDPLSAGSDAPPEPAPVERQHHRHPRPHDRITVDLDRASIIAALARASLAVLVRWRPNAFWLVAVGAAMGLAHALL